MKRLAVRVLVIVVYGLAAVGTPAAYIYLVLGVLGGLEGIATGKRRLCAALSVLSLVALFALWRLWSIGARLWRDGAYVNFSRKDQAFDAFGLAHACIAFVGFNAIAELIFRPIQVLTFTVLLAPATGVALLAFLWSAITRRKIRTSDVDATAKPGLVSAFAALTPADLPGVAAGIVIGLLGVAWFSPSLNVGHGFCDWTMLYPLHSGLWPVDTPEAYDGCRLNAGAFSTISAALSLACLLAGAFAAVIGQNANAARGACASLIVVVFALAKQAIRMSQLPGAEHIGWGATLAVGAFVAGGATWLGYLGGRCGARVGAAARSWRKNESARSPESRRDFG